jgi:hypothetical protein
MRGKLLCLVTTATLLSLIDANERQRGYPLDDDQLAGSRLAATSITWRPLYRFLSTEVMAQVA